MKFIRAILIALLGALPLGASAAESAASVVDKVTKKIQGAPSISAQFTVSQGNDRASGTMLMSGNCFTLEAAGMQTWFDGKTQWTLSKEVGEVNVTEPSREEIIESNPFAVLSDLKKAYSLRLLSAPKGFYKVELLPRDKKNAPIAKAVVTVNASTWLPTEIAVTSTDGRAAVVRIASLKVGKALQKSVFRFNSKSHPGIEIVDLR